MFARAVAMQAFEPIEIKREQTVIHGGPLRSPWLVYPESVEGTEFIPLRPFKDRPLRAWLGEKGSMTCNECVLVENLTILRTEEEDKKLQELVVDNDPLGEADTAERAQKRKRLGIEALPRILTLTYKAFQYKDQDGNTHDHDAFQFRVLRTERDSKSNLYIELLERNLQFLCEAAMDDAVWLEGEDEKPKGKLYHDRLLPEPHDTRVKWRTFTSQKPLLAITFVNREGKKVTKMKTPLLVGDEEMWRNEIKDTVDNLVRLADNATCERQGQPVSRQGE